LDRCSMDVRETQATYVTISGMAADPPAADARSRRVE
jgi:hypothetical protein